MLYKTPLAFSQQNYRKGIFAENMEIIQQHNREYDEGKHTWYMGVNSMSDWTPEEFMNRNNLRRPEFKDDEPFSNIEGPFISSGDNQKSPSTPTSTDWRNEVKHKEYYCAKYLDVP
mgnify:CR=1 FL=1